MRQTVRVKNKTEFRPVSPVGGAFINPRFPFPPTDRNIHSGKKERCRDNRDNIQTAGIRPEHRLLRKRQFTA